MNPRFFNVMQRQLNSFLQIGKKGKILFSQHTAYTSTSINTVLTQHRYFSAGSQDIPKTLSRWSLFKAYFVPQHERRELGIIPLNFYHLGKEQFNQNNNRAALSSFRKMLMVDPLEGELPLYSEVGDILYHKNFEKEAVGFWEIAYSLTKKNYSALLHLGHFYLKQGNFAKAQDVLKDALMLAPKDVVAHNELGMIHALKAVSLSNKQAFDGEKQLSIVQFEEALKLEPGRADIHQNLEVIKMLSHGPTYGVPHKGLAIKEDFPTCMFNAMVSELDKNKEYDTPLVVGKVIIIETHKRPENYKLLEDLKPLKLENEHSKSNLSCKG